MEEMEEMDKCQAVTGDEGKIERSRVKLVDDGALRIKFNDMTYKKAWQQAESNKRLNMATMHTIMKV